MDVFSRGSTFCRRKDYHNLEYYNKAVVGRGRNLVKVIKISHQKNPKLLKAHGEEAGFGAWVYLVNCNWEHRRRTGGRGGRKGEVPLAELFPP